MYSFPDMDSSGTDTARTACVQPQGVNERDLARAARLARNLGLPLCRESRATCIGPALLVAEGCLGLKAPQRERATSAEVVYFPDWTRIDTTSRFGRRSGQPLLRAVQGRRRRKGLMVWDATAGWGEDAWILAALGHRVLAVERDFLIHCCLLDAWSRAAFTAPMAARRIRPVRADSMSMLQQLAMSPSCRDLPPGPDVVYLDPFFPVQKGKKSRERKSARVLRLTAGDGAGDAEELLRSALAVSRLRVVLKRPRKAQALSPNGREPVHSIAGRGFRYDIYIPRKDAP